ncbi:MAG: amidase, partial [Rhodobacteraceae bacterium]|nr:amidase [Paracoccaceae bacterium]
WDTRLNAAGSSGGAAVSLATGEVWLSHGADHGGSLRTPAAYNGIVGRRPSPGIAAGDSEAGFIIEGQQGPMARSVRDCALFLDAMAGFQPAAPTSYPAPDTPYQRAVIEADSKVRIGFAPDLNGFSLVEPEIDAHLRGALALVEKNGGTVIEACPDLPELERTYHTLRGQLWATVFKRAPESLTRHFKATLAENTVFGRALTMDDIAEANLNRTTLFKNMLGFHETFDVLACPTVGNMPRPVEVEWVHEINGEILDGYMDWLRFAFLSTTTGLPSISVPVGLSGSGIPIGLQLIGPPRGEAKLLSVARAVEMATGGPLGPIDPNVTHL